MVTDALKVIFEHLGGYGELFLVGRVGVDNGLFGGLDLDVVMGPLNKAGDPGLDMGVCMEGWRVSVSD